LDECFFYMA